MGNLILLEQHVLKRFRIFNHLAGTNRHTIERFIGNTWIASTQEHEAVYALWSAFRDECILGRGGMTLNERLHAFDLLEAWDSAPDEESRAAIRRKVDFAASPST